MSAKEEAQEWAEIVAALGERNGLTYEPVGGINPKDGPVALCAGRRQPAHRRARRGFWGACCDADEHEDGGFGRKAVLPGAMLAKAHMPDLAKVVPAFNVESIERTPRTRSTSRSRRRVEFESIDFNKRFIATVPQRARPGRPARALQPRLPRLDDADPAEIDFGITDRQLFFLWRLRERTARS